MVVLRSPAVIGIVLSCEHASWTLPPGEDLGVSPEVLRSQASWDHGAYEIAARVEYDGPLAAPVEQGAEVAQLVVEVPGLPDPFRLPLVAGHSVAEGGILPRLRTAALVLGGQLGLTEP